MNSTDNLLELQNNRRGDELSHKVTILKSFAKDIESEVKYQNTFMDDIQNSFETASGLLNNTLHRVMGIRQNRAPNRKLLCYTILFIAIGLFIVYLFVFRRS